MRRLLLPVAGLLLLLGVVGGTAGPASAHASLLRSDPADGAELTSLPGELTLTFSEPVRGTDGAVEVTGPGGGPLDVELRTEGRRLVVDLGGAEAVSGAYDVVWAVTSTDDHDIDGSFAFSVALPAPASPTATAPAPAVPPSGGDEAGEPPVAAAAPSTGSGAVDALAVAALLVGVLALAVLLAGALGTSRLARAVQPAWWVAAGAGLLLLPLLQLRVSERPLGDLTDAGVWLGGLLSWSGLVVVVVVAAAALATRAAPTPRSRPA